jgi:hypothetical protein
MVSGRDGPTTGAAWPPRHRLTVVMADVSAAPVAARREMQAWNRGI